MQKFTEDEIAQAYAYYGVQLSGVEPKQTGPLEDVILAVIENPPPGRFISTLPALIARNRAIVNFDYLVREVHKSSEASAKFGYLLDVTIGCVAGLEHPNKESFVKQLQEKIKKLKRASEPVVWIAEDSKKWYSPDFQPKEEHEIKWNVTTRYALERFQDHWKSYVRNA